MYNAVVATITNVVPIEGKDKIKKAKCLGYTIIVASTIEEGTRGVFFESDGQLSQDFATINDLIRRKDENGNAAGGFFEENRRVRNLKLGQVVSEGFWTPLKSFDYTGYDLTKEPDGFEFNELNDRPICNKYITPASMRGAGRNKEGKVKFLENPAMPKHIETLKLKRSIGNIPNEGLLIITEKLHGTSHRLAKAPVRFDVPTTKVKEFFRRLFRKPKQRFTEYVRIDGSRNFSWIFKTPEEFTHPYKDSCRMHAIPHKVALQPGEAIYGEIVGYEPSGNPIMSRHNSTCLKDKQLFKLFGETVIYHYGNPVNESTFYVYRITKTDQEGNTIELTWDQVLRRAAELEMKTVPELARIYKTQYTSNDEILKTCIDISNGQSSCLSDTTPREGIVLRTETPTPRFFKVKSDNFCIMEGLAKDDEKYVDLEDTE